MTKTRQQDFARVHLKPGRPLKRTNLPSLKFKSRKIVMPKERVVKAKSEYTIGDCTRRLKTASNEKDKSKLLNELNRVIHRQSESLKTELNKIFETVIDLIRDPHDEVRNTAMKIILYVLENTEDFQLRYYANILNKHLSAIMKNPNPKIATSSLVLLDCMVKNHPDLICHNMDILNDLLPTEKAHFTRQPAFERGTFLYTETEEVNNLGHINTFLKSMLEIKSDLAKDEDDKDVYMDENKRMSLVLYSTGGLKPIDIEEVYSKQFNPQVDLFEQAETIKKVISSLVSIIPGIFSRIIRCQSSAVDNTLKSESVIDLSIIAQLLYHMVETAERISHTVATEEIATIIKEKLYSPYKKRFPFELQTVLPGGALLEPLAMLNTSLCFLFMKFLFSNDSCDSDWQLVEKYLKKFFAPDKTYTSEIKCKCIPLFIKMIQLFSYKTHVPDAIFLLLNQLVIFLKTRINHPNKKKLINFLCDMSILPEYQFWFESEPMMLWFSWLLSHLKENAQKLDRKLAKIICKISKLRHASFMNLLDFSVIKFLLKHRNEDYKETGITLLSHMDIDKKTFKNVYDIISLDSFPRKLAVTLVHMLNARFHQSSLSEKIHVEYIEFLLNTALGTYNISRNRFVDLNDNRYTKAVTVVHHGYPCTIVPSLYWKEHSELFQVCLSYLRNFPIGPVSFLFSRLVQDIMKGSREVIPIHCALAILKLDMTCKIKDEQYHQLMLRLNFSCLMTISVLTQSSMDDEWFKWNICELVNSIPLTEELAYEIFEQLLHNAFSRVDKLDGLVVYFILRVVKVFVKKELLNFQSQATMELVLRVLVYLADECTDESLRYQPLYLQLNNYFMQFIEYNV